MLDQILISLPEGWRHKPTGPLYRALYEVLRTLCLAPETPVGEKLPASRLLAERLKVSRNTVNEAYALLVSEGYLESRQGAGFFVNSQINPAVLSRVSNSPEHRVEEIVGPIAPRASDISSLFDTKRHKQVNQAFAPGRPALEEFPFDQWGRMISRQWRLRGAQLAAEEDPKGYKPLRTHIAKHLRDTRAVRCHEDQVIIVSGAQQGLDLIGRVLWQAGDKIVIDDPSFPGIHGVIQSLGCETVPVDVDSEGMIIEGSFSNAEKVNSFLLAPSRNYPLGVTLSLGRRMKLLARARALGAWIIEDDFDCDFRFDGPPLSSLQGLDDEGRVIYVGTFSRVLFPALRLGFVVVPRNLVAPFEATKAFMDGHASIVHQAALSDFFEDGLFASHLRRMRKIYAARRAFLMQKLEEEFGDYFEIFPSDGGLHLSVVLKLSIRDVDFCSALAKENVIARPLSRFYRSNEAQNGLVLGFAGYERDEMARALAVIKKLLEKMKIELSFSE